jgi:hypothetical protein
MGRVEMIEEHRAAGWRELSLVVGERLGRPVGVGRIRWAVESSGQPIGTKIGNILVFSEADVEAAVALVRERLARQDAGSGGDGARENQA